MALSATALITVAEAGAHLKLDAATISTDTSLLEALIASATQMVEDYTGQAFVSRSKVETHIGDGGTMLRLWAMPVLAVSDVKIDDVSLTTYDPCWTERLSIGRIYWDSGFTLDSEVEVSYTAGHGARATAQAACPQAVLAVKLLVAQMYNDREGVKDISVSGVGSQSYDRGLWKAIAHPLKVNIL